MRYTSGQPTLEPRHLATVDASANKTTAGESGRVTDPRRQLSTPSDTKEFYLSTAVATAGYLFAVKDVPLPHPQAVRESIDNGVCSHERRVPSDGIVGARSAIALLLLLVGLAPGTEEREQQGRDQTIT